MNLFGFQSEDVEKLKSKRSRLIGNDPGTGKTYEGIALDQLNRKSDGHPKVTVPRNAKTLVVCPASVISVWDNHCMELTAEDVYVIDRKNRKPFIDALCDKRTSGYFICNWEALRLIEPTLAKKKVEFFHIIADECHRSKNRKAQQTRALKKLKATYKTGMSGTPADNKPQDLWSILNWLWPSYYTAYWAFVKAYMVHELSDEGYMKLTGLNMETLPRLWEEMKPWYVRRRKEDVLPDLPDKYNTRMWVDLDPKQRKAYDQMRKTMVAWVDSYKEELERQDPIIAQAAVSQLVRLQQFADGYMVPKLNEAGVQVTKRKHKGHKRGEPCGLLCRDVLVWDMVDPSSKLDAVMDLLEDRDEEQIVIFSQFKTVINLFESRLKAKQISYGLLTGDVSQSDRATYVEAFQSGKIRVFAGTIAAGGVGLTLTAARTVVFIDRSWSPAVNLQAEDRLHRIGQKDAVEVIDLMARNTVDMGKHQKLALKWKLLQMLLGDKVSPDLIIEELEKEESGELIQKLTEDEND